MKSRTKPSVASKNSIEDQITEISCFVKRDIACYLTTVADNFLKFYAENKKTSAALIKCWLDKICNIIANAVKKIFKKGYFQDRILLRPLKQVLNECDQNDYFLLPKSVTLKKKIITFLQENINTSPKDPLHYRDHFISIKQFADCVNGRYCLKDFDRMGSGVSFNGVSRAITEKTTLKELYDFLKANLFFSIFCEKSKEALCHLFAMHTHQGGFNYAIATLLQFDMADNLSINDYQAYVYLLPKVGGVNSEVDFNFYPLESGYGVSSMFSYFEEEGDNKKCILKLITNHEITLDLSNLDAIDYDNYEFICTGLACEVEPCTQKGEEGAKESANQYLLGLKEALDEKARHLYGFHSNVESKPVRKTLTAKRDNLQAIRKSPRKLQTYNATANDGAKMFDRKNKRKSNGEFNEEDVIPTKKVKSRLPKLSG